MKLRIIRNEKAIRALRSQIAELLERTGQTEDVTLAPEYFLQNNALRCAPLLVLIYEGEQIVAALYGRERRVFGIRTGLVQFGDYYGEGAVMAQEPFKAKAVAQVANKVLDLPRVHWVRASFKLSNENHLATVESLIDKDQVKTRLLPEKVQHVLPLKSTFDAFLGTLGSHTRRNLRVYRRRVEQKGWRFVPGLDPEQAATAMAALGQQQGKHKSSAHYLDCCRDALREVPGSVYAGICTETGEWVSVAAGWLRNEQYFMLIQLNDSRYKRDSISTVMRSYLIENVIGSGVRAINFVGGSSELLGQFCTPQTCAHYLFERKGPLSKVRDFIAPRLFGYSMVSRIIRGGGTSPVDLSPVDLSKDEGRAVAPAKAPDSLEQTVLDCWRSVLGIPNLNLESNFFDADVPLKQAARLMARISVELSVKFPTGLLIEAPTPRRLAERIRDRRRLPIGCVVPMQTKGSQSPVYMVHDIHGDILLYRPLADLFAPDRPVFGVQVPGDLTSAQSCSTESLAAVYVKEILALNTGAPIHLAGFSSGSVLAFEMARQLTEKGYEVGMLALIDGDINNTEPALPLAERCWKIAVRKACKIAFKLNDELAAGPKQFVVKRLQYLWFLWNMRKLENAARRGAATARTIEEVLALAERAYRPQPSPGSALLIRFHDEAWKFGPNPLMGWSDLFRGGLRIVDLPGGHAKGMDESRAPGLARLLASQMANIEAAPVAKLAHAATCSGPLG